MTESEVEVPVEVIAELAARFLKNGHVRRQNINRIAAEGSQKYKKGDEVRLTANTRSDLRRLRRLLQAARFTPGREFSKGRRWRIPVYGRAEVARFLALISSAPGVPPPA